MSNPRRCAYCGKGIKDPLGWRVWTTFCSAEHCHLWQLQRTEKQIMEVASGPDGNDVCQWCRSALRSGWHDDKCPVRRVKHSSA